MKITQHVAKCFVEKATDNKKIKLIMCIWDSYLYNQLDNNSIIEFLINQQWFIFYYNT